MLQANPSASTIRSAVTRCDAISSAHPLHVVRSGDMNEHEPPGYDDWFDEPEPPTLEQGRGSRPSYDAPSETEEDVWTLPEDEPRRSRRPQRGGDVGGGLAHDDADRDHRDRRARDHHRPHRRVRRLQQRARPRPHRPSNTTPTTLPTTTTITTTITVRSPTAAAAGRRHQGAQVKLLQARAQSRSVTYAAAGRRAISAPPRRARSSVPERQRTEPRRRRRPADADSAQASRLSG